MLLALCCSEQPLFTNWGQAMHVSWLYGLVWRSRHIQCSVLLLADEQAATYVLFWQRAVIVLAVLLVHLPPYLFFGCFCLLVCIQA